MGGNISKKKKDKKNHAGPSEHHHQYQSGNAGTHGQPVASSSKTKPISAVPKEPKAAVLKDKSKSAMTSGTDNVAGDYSDDFVQQQLQAKQHREVVYGEQTNRFQQQTEALRVVQKAPKTKQLLVDAMGDCLLFSGMTAKQKEFIAAIMDEQSVEAGVNVLEQGQEYEDTASFYVVESGTLAVLVDGNEVGQIKQGGYFGELALLYHSPRAATITAQTVCALWKVSAKDFKQAHVTIAFDENRRALDAIERVKEFKNLTHYEKTQIVAACSTTTYQEGAKIIRQGDTGDKFYIVADGKAKVQQTTPDGTGVQDIAQLSNGDYFGERALIKDDTRAATVIATGGPVTCLSITREDFNNLLGPLEEILERNFETYHRAVLAGIPILQVLSPQELSELANKLQTEQFKKDAQIIKQGDVGDKFYILAEGEVELTQDVSGKVIELGHLYRGAYFGERALLNDDKRAANVKAYKDCTCLSLDRTNFDNILGSLRERFQLAEPLGLHTEIKLENLQHLATLGAGSFGRVALVKDTATGKTYALKVLKKYHIIKTKQIDHVVNEKTIMAEMQPHPFIVRLYRTFRDTRYIYFLMEPILGGELFTYMRRKGKLENDQAVLYAAQVFSAFEHMHALSIVYRDLKPENILISSDGYLKIIDLGFAKRIDGRTYTVCGTPEYLAPEIIRGGHGHGFAVDWWCTGILIYEMFVGITPFLAPDPMSVYKKIVTATVRCPAYIPNDAKDLIYRLLVKMPTKRLGSLKNGSNDIKYHPWFKNIDWQALRAKKYTMPYVPKVKSEDDHSNFNSKVQLKDAQDVECYDPFEEAFD
eukprot:Clim_evm5s19 gene=Clim_evmTU5s19